MEKEERAEYTLDFMRRYTGLDLNEYFANTFWLDRIILNEDRHYNNLSVIFSQKNGFRIAPIFDNGKSFLVGNLFCKNKEPMEDKVKKVVARPFSGSHRWNYDYFKKHCNIEINKDDLICDLSCVPDSFEKEVLMFQLNNQEK